MKTMKIIKLTAILFAVIICLFAAALMTSCGDLGSGDAETPTPDETDAPPAETQSETPPPDEIPDETPDETPDAPAPEIKLVPYDGVVEHIFFHEVIAWPELAFDGSSTQKGYDDNMVTVYEYKKILESLYNNGFILVDMNDVWSEYTNDNGARRMQKNTLMLPEGKKPIVISFDDLSFYSYMAGDGFMEKYIVGDDGDIWAVGLDPSGNRIVSQDLAAVTILDKFVKQNPGFSLGAKGCIALTGYEGILGYRTHFDRNNDTQQAKLERKQEIARVRPVVQRLKETGWYFATHSYGHINLEKASLNGVVNDANRWLDEVGSLVGETKIFIYPFGTRLDGNDVYSTGSALLAYIDLGFRYFASVGYEPFTSIKSDIPAVMLDRMNSDGITLRNSRERFLRFYDAREVFDPSRPSGEGYTVKW